MLVEQTSHLFFSPGLNAAYTRVERVETAMATGFTLPAPSLRGLANCVASGSQHSPGVLKRDGAPLVAVSSIKFLRGAIRVTILLRCHHLVDHESEILFTSKTHGGDH